MKKQTTLSISLLSAFLVGVLSCPARATLDVGSTIKFGLTAGLPEAKQTPRFTSIEEMSIVRSQPNPIQKKTYVQLNPFMSELEETLGVTTTELKIDLDNFDMEYVIHVK